MILDIIQHNESEFGFPVPDVILSFFQDGESLSSVSDILLIPRLALARLCREHGLLPFCRSRRPALQHTEQSRRVISIRTSRAMRARRTGYNVKWLHWRGEERCLADWADVVGVERHTLNMRLRRGWEVSRALSTPVLK